MDFASEISSVCDIDIFSGDDGLSKVSIIPYKGYYSSTDFTVVLVGLTLPLMALGGKGIVSVAANICPGKMAQLCNAMKNGDLKTAQQLHKELYALCKTLFCETNPIPCKAAGKRKKTLMKP